MTIERYQWMRNREGGQRFGTRTMILTLDELSRLRSISIHGLPRNITHVRLAQPAGTGPWFLDGASTTSETLRPRNGTRMFAFRVPSFDAPVALVWGRTADSDVYPIGSYDLDPCQHGPRGVGDPLFGLKAIAMCVGLGIGVFVGLKRL